MKCINNTTKRLYAADGRLDARACGDIQLWLCRGSGVK